MELIVTPSQREHLITHLTGTAAPPVIPKAIRITGNIKAPGDYLRTKTAQGNVNEENILPPAGLNYFQHPTLQETIITIDIDANTITLEVDPNSPFGTVVVGKLEYAEEIKKFNIDSMVSTTMLTGIELANLIKRNKRYFVDENLAIKLQGALQNLKVTSTSNIEQSHDTRGNHSAALAIKVDSASIPQFFALKIPVLKGFPAFTFMVEVCIIKTDAKIAFWLESPELEELIETNKAAIFEAELEEFSAFVIIRK